MAPRKEKFAVWRVPARPERLRQAGRGRLVGLAPSSYSHQIMTVIKIINTEANNSFRTTASIIKNCPRGIIENAEASSRDHGERSRVGCGPLREHPSLAANPRPPGGSRASQAEGARFDACPGALSLRRA